MVLALLLLPFALTAGCGGSDDPTDAQRSPADSISITFTGDTVDPKGDRVEVAAGEPVELVVEAETPGELHVHSTPEQQLPYGVGTTTLSVTIDAPGIVEVESHELGVTVVQLAVR